jgi:hypothetical protein
MPFFRQRLEIEQKTDEDEKEKKRRKKEDCNSILGGHVYDPTRVHALH